MAHQIIVVIWDESTTNFLSVKFLCWMDEREAHMQWLPLVDYTQGMRTQEPVAWNQSITMKKTTGLTTPRGSPSFGYNLQSIKTKTTLLPNNLRVKLDCIEFHEAPTFYYINVKYTMPHKPQAIFPLATSNLGEGLVIQHLVMSCKRSTRESNEIFPWGSKFVLWAREITPTWGRCDWEMLHTW